MDNQKELEKEFYKKFVKQQNILDATEENKIIYGGTAMTKPDEVWNWFSSKLKEEREEIARDLWEDLNITSVEDLPNYDENNSYTIDDCIEGFTDLVSEQLGKLKSIYQTK